MENGNSHNSIRSFTIAYGNRMTHIMEYFVDIFRYANECSFFVARPFGRTVESLMSRWFVRQIRSGKTIWEGKVVLWANTNGGGKFF